MIDETTHGGAGLAGFKSLLCLHALGDGGAPHPCLVRCFGSSPEKRQRHHPIGYFELEPRMRKVTAKLDYSANFKYVIVTLLSARQRALLGEARNIDIQRIALLGQAEPVCHDRVEWQ
eukprot:TRINITY_DN12550_c0_g2_i5.p7 TRINITY_DN12550_c0_g2~~TRINITY_DN12550_c0_g2_i5.p7  ORF type:complete len:118 (+),score=19.77 TRINITY_DN12550_c0_g2_i5:661-1014(+)